MALREIDLVQVRRSGEHFKKTLREIFEHIPRTAHSIAGLARWTGVNKSTCQRLVQALTKSVDGIDVIITLPGPGGLNQINSKFKKLINDQESLSNFAQMVGEYENLIFDYATSQSELKRILLQSQAQGAGTKDSYTRKLRKVAYETNREISGETVDLYVAIHVLRVNKDDDSYLDELVVANRVGVELSRNARPFVQAFSGNQKAITVTKPVSVNSTNIHEKVTNESGEYLLEDFSTMDIESCFSGVGSLKNSLIYNHTLAPVDSKKFDISVVFLDYKTQRNPIQHEHKIFCQSLMQRSPAKRIFMLSLIEKELDRASTIQSGCYPSSIKAHEIGHNPEDLWSERFSDSAEIKLFKPTEEGIGTKSNIPHIDALMSQVFEILGDDPARYIGYHLDLDYPLWLTSQRIYYDFS
ncbi:hypothetical protein [Aliikangiella coralliicola]|uniref:Uncharacterized protein n=1 Tax=Aliikangiella coralliicola TaxID=2592383 RepID=A0A545UJV0_9GAMM|nr:hypothetical protein [Aliikangiella coralliicola]TQV89734.1 hypothetical protein FLL46_02310 [Aliikangiella coralliicola]